LTGRRADGFESGDLSAWSVSVTETDFGYTGQRAVAGFGLMDYRARFYSSYLNRWTQPDTIIPSYSNPQSLNRYSYVYNSPVKYTDPDGHNPYDCFSDPKCAIPVMGGVNNIDNQWAQWYIDRTIDNYSIHAITTVRYAPGPADTDISDGLLLGIHNQGTQEVDVHATAFYYFFEYLDSSSSVSEVGFAGFIVHELTHNVLEGEARNNPNSNIGRLYGYTNQDGHHPAGSGAYSVLQELLSYGNEFAFLVDHLSASELSNYAGAQRVENRISIESEKWNSLISVVNDVSGENFPTDYKTYYSTNSGKLWD
jgi:RHS repeat-associated protein